MRQVRITGSLPLEIAEDSELGDWIANLSVSGDIWGLQSIEAIGPGGSYFLVQYSPGSGRATVTPAARPDYEAFTAMGQVPDLAFSFRLTFSDGTRQDDTTLHHVRVLDRDDTPPTELRFAAGGSVTAGEIGSVIGTLAVTDPDSIGPFFFTIAEEDAWRFEVVGTTLKLRDGISLGLDDMPHRPVVIEVSDGRQSAAFSLDLTVRAPAADESSVPILGIGETRGGFTRESADHVLTLQSSDAVAAINRYGGDVRQVVLKGGGEIWLEPVERLQFADGWFDFDPDGAAAQAASLHRTLFGGAVTGAELAGYVAELEAGTAWADLAERLLGTGGNAAPEDIDYVTTLHRGAHGEDPDGEELVLAMGRLASGTSRAQLAVDLAFSIEALGRLAEANPDGLWVAWQFGGGPAAPGAGPDATSPDPGMVPELGWLL